MASIGPSAHASDTAQTLVRFDGVTKRFSDLIAVDRVSLDIARGEFFALLGPSGCGKTTLLRLLAGFETPDQGRILLNGADVAGLPPYRRAVNMMFQNYALFPHLTVESNVAFGLRQESLPREEIDKRVSEMMALVQIVPLARRKPHQLSGGQRQRVALARALVKRPKVFLLDEPLAALDKKLRAETQFELKELQKTLGLTFIVVTHDQEEAMTMADRIGVMNEGRLVQVAPPAEVYEQPNSRWVAQFIGDINLLEGHAAEVGAGAAVIKTSAAGCLRVAQSGGVAVGDPVAVAVRPEKVRLGPFTPLLPPENAASGIVEGVAYLGDVSLYKVKLETGFTMKATIANLTRLTERPTAGERVTLGFPPEACTLLTR